MSVERQFAFFCVAFSAADGLDAPDPNQGDFVLDGAGQL
jgi:hypothetical protein